MSVLVALGLGIGLGIFTGLPLGVVNVAIVDAATTNRVRFATGLGIGGAIADATHAALAFIGVGQLVTNRPELVRWLALGAAVVIIGYAIVAWRLRRKTIDRESGDRSSLVRGVVTGCSLTLPNPGSLAAWVAVATVIWPDASVTSAVAVACGVGLGSAGWFIVLARWVSRVRPDHPVLKIVARGAVAILVATAILGIVRFVI